MKDKIEFIAFDADDTLWESELYIQEFEHKFCNLFKGGETMRVKVRSV